MIALSISIVCATVLLSNDMKHLRSLLATFGYEPAVTVIQPPPLVRQGRVFKPGKIKILPRLIAAPDTKLAAVFLRFWRRDGEQYCDAVRQAGIEVSKWESSELFETGTYECSYERSWSDGPVKRSVFYLVRGNSSGLISTIRAKLVNPRTEANGELSRDITAEFASFIDAAGWTDLSGETAGPITRLEDVKFQAFGALLSFSREPTSKSSFNLILSTAPVTDLQKKTFFYFERESWLPLSDQSWAQADAERPTL